MSEAPVPLTIGVVTDLHYTPDGTGLSYHGPFDVPGVLERLAAALEWFADQGADVVVVAGDLTNGGDHGSLEVVFQALAQGWAGHIEVVPGNHDLLRREDALPRAATDRVRVLEPTGRVLRGLRLAGVGWDLEDCAADIAAWADEPTVLISHFPVISRADAFAHRGLRYAGDRPGIDAIRKPLATRSTPTLIINGHLHATDHVRDAQLLQLTVAALVEPPFEAALITVHTDGRSLLVEHRARFLGPARGAPRHRVDQSWVLPASRR